MTKTAIGITALAISESKDVHAVSCRICTSLGTGVCPAHTFSAFFRYGSGENSGS